MKLICLLLVSWLFAANAAPVDSNYYPFEKEIYEVNSVKGIGWVAGRQKRFEGRTEEYVKGLCGVKSLEVNLPIKDIPVLQDIPDTFDARTAWPQCKTIGLIEDQSNCGSCWAFGATESMSDRYCIVMNKSILISAENLMDCCRDCGNGCEGGFPGAAWEFWEETGLVTGGLYVAPNQDANTCQPYSLPSCEHHINGSKPACPSKIARTPSCQHTCHQGYKVPYAQDVHHGASSYSVRGIEKIQTEIMTHGPVEASFTVYADFPHYKSGVYSRHSLHALGGHAVKMMGWGTEDGTDYWLIANSWNTDWGDKGYFKILRGKDECGIESGIAAGMPKD